MNGVLTLKHCGHFSVGSMEKLERDKVFPLPRDINTPGKKIQLYTSNQITELPGTCLQ